MTWERKSCHTKTIQLGKSDNVSICYLDPGYIRYQLFCQEAEISIDNETLDPIIASEAKIQVDEETHETEVTSMTTMDTQSWRQHDTEEYNKVNFECDSQVTLSSEQDERLLNKTSVVTAQDNNDYKSESNSSELLRYNYKYGHASFKKLQSMAKQKLIPKRLAKCPINFCTACLYAKAHKRPWRPKTSPT